MVFGLFGKKKEKVTGVAKPAKKEIPEEDRVEVSITLFGEQHELVMDRNMPILDQALDSGLTIPYSCHSGDCTSCRAKCHSGRIDTASAHGLSEKELGEGYVLTCVGKVLEGPVSITIG